MLSRIFSSAWTILAAVVCLWLAGSMLAGWSWYLTGWPPMRVDWYQDQQQGRPAPPTEKYP